MLNGNSAVCFVGHSFTNSWAAISWLLFGGVVVANVSWLSLAEAGPEMAMIRSARPDKRRQHLKNGACSFFSPFNRQSLDLLFLF